MCGKYVDYFSSPSSVIPFTDIVDFFCWGGGWSGMKGSPADKGALLRMQVSLQTFTECQ